MKRLFLLILIIVCGSCFDQNDCVITSTNLVKIDLQTVAGISKTATFRVVQQDSVGPNRRSSIRYGVFEKVPLTSMKLPVDPTAEKSYYSFLTSDSIRFHLALNYTAYTRVISDDCGAFLYYQNLAVDTAYTDFPLTRMVVPQLLTSVTSNLKLLY